MNLTGTMIPFRAGDARFLMAEKFADDELRAFLAQIDRHLEQSVVLKDSPTTTAGLVTLRSSARSFFLKRTNNKGFRFTCRYLFRKARAFRAAKAALLLKDLGIATPEVVAVGEKRSGLILKSGYLVTTTADGICGMEKIFKTTTEPYQILDPFLEYAGTVMAKLHNGHIVHGDLKLHNFYRIASTGEFGIWDLDSVRKFNNTPPRHLILEELGLLTAFSSLILQKNPAVLAEDTSCAVLAEKLLNAYLPHAHAYNDFLTKEQLIRCSQDHLDRILKKRSAGK